MKYCTLPRKGPKTLLLQSHKEATEGTLGFLTPLLLCGRCHGPLPHVTLACTTLVLLGRGQATQKCQELKQTHLAGSPSQCLPFTTVTSTLNGGQFPEHLAITLVFFFSSLGLLHLA